MSIFLLILMIFLVAGLLFCFYMLIRNEQVCRFRKKIIDMAFSGGDIYKKVAIYDRVKYGYMLYSLKRLRLESFYSEEEIKTLTA